MFVEELRDFCKGLLRLGRSDVAIILRMRLALIDLEHCVDASLPQLAVDAYCVAKQKISRAAHCFQCGHNLSSLNGHMRAHGARRRTFRR